MTVASSGPTTIMLIRHGEKQQTPPPFGVNAEGVEDKHSLTVRGWQRAGALVQYFRFPRVAEIVTPDAIFASAVGPVSVLIDGEDVGKSLRPQQTVAPLAAALSLSVVTDWAVGQETQLADAIRARRGAVLVAWEHKHIPTIAAQFTEAAPTVWPGEVFDLVWVLRRDGDGYSFTQVAQRVLAGDGLP